MVPYQKLFQALSEHQIKYLVAGGFAVNFHQIQRATMDLDLILHLEKNNLEKFSNLMSTLGFAPRIPADISSLSDHETRELWIHKKNMIVFSFYHEKNRMEVVDIFIQEPKPFIDLEARKMTVEAFGLSISVVGLDDLIEMKRLAGRERDLFDVSQLEKVRKLK